MGALQSPDDLGDDSESGAAAADQPRHIRKLEHNHQSRHTRNLPAEESAARFRSRERPQRYATGMGRREPTRPPDPIMPYMPPPVARRHRSEWPIMVLAMVIASIVMAAFCLGGFALHSGYPIPFLK